MWKLSHGELLEMGLKVGQRHRYMEAKRLRLEEQKNGSKFIIQFKNQHRSYHNFFFVTARKKSMELKFFFRYDL